MQFPTEEAKMNAILELPDAPPRDVTDIDAWMAEIEGKKLEIEQAEVVPEAKPDEAVETPPQETQKEVPTETPQETVDDVVKFEFKRDDLPEELRGYKNGEEMVKQLGHARNFANAAEERLAKQSTEINDLREQAKAVEDLKKQVEDLKSAKDTLSVQPQTPEVRQQISSLDETLNSLDHLGDEDYVNGRDVKKVIGAAAKELTIAASVIKQANEDFATYRTNSERKFEELSTGYDTIKKDTQATKENDLNNKKHKAVIEGLGQLQTDHSELKTTKQLVGKVDSVENDVRKFGNRISSLKTGNATPDWSVINSYVNGYLRGDPEIKAFCQQNGITPESVGANAEDIGKYALLSTVDAAMRGESIDPYSGERKALLSEFNGQPINLTSYEMAYNHIRHDSGIADRELAEKIIEAEKNAQKNIDEALEKKDLASKVLGNKGEADPSNIGQDLTEDQANSILNDPYIAEKIEFGGRDGDWKWFRMYNKAIKRWNADKPDEQKMPESKPEDHWRPEKSV